VIGLEDHHEVEAELTELTRQCSRHGVRIFVDESIYDDIQRDRDQNRRTVTRSKLNKFEILRNIQYPDDATLARKYGAINSSNDRSDCRLLHCIELQAVNFLITRDRRLRHRSSRTGLGKSVLSVEEALVWLRQTFEPKAVELPHISEREAYALNREDPIFDSLREGYPTFDPWFEKCAQEHRRCWVVEVGTKIAGIIIRKDERRVDSGIVSPGQKILKICTFKMAPEFRGEKFGEQLLKKALWFAQVNRYDVIYLTAYPDQEVLIELLESYGFHETKRKDDGELFLEKVVRHGTLKLDVGRSPLEITRQCYPRFYDGPEVSKYVVPIQGDYHLTLFPEIGFVSSVPLFPERKLISPYGARNGEVRTPGNTIRKVYLCRAQIRRLKPGDLLFFYLSKDERLAGSQCLTTIGVVEQVIECTDLIELIRLTAKRSVFSANMLEEMHNESSAPIKVIDFLLAGHLESPIPLNRLIESDIFNNRPPQSISGIDERKYGHLRPMLSLGFDL
jgi:ribosomal protein S18 acetylase RimI-like enzyme